MKNYSVVVKGGHCGNKRYRPLTFLIYASNAVSAMDIARAMPGVKHGEMILSCTEITKEEAKSLGKVSAYSRYGRMGKK